MGEASSAVGKGHRGRSLFLLATGLLAAGLLGEALVRAFYGDEVDTEALRARDRQLEVGAFIRPAASPGLLYELEPGVRREWYGVTVVTSADGCCRESSKASPAPPGAVKVALLGDSTPFGWKIDYDHAYGELFRKRLRARLGGDVELRDFAVPGYNAGQERIAFREKVLPWAPDLVILHYDHNDPDPTNTAPVSYIAPEYGDNVLRSALWKFVRRRVRVAQQSRLPLFRADGGREVREVDGFRADGPRYDRHLADLRELAGTATAAGIPVVALLYDSGLRPVTNAAADPHYAELHRNLAGHLEASGYHVLDLYPRYQQLMAANGWTDLTSFWIAPEDGHPNRYGHLFIAEQLLDYVLGQADLMERLRRPGSPTPGAGS